LFEYRIDLEKKSPKRFFSGIVLLSGLFLVSAIAIPVENPSGPGLLKRAPGDTQYEPIEATFDIHDWPNIAEEDCYITLCILGGNRV
jgi:hypothetical protein